MGYNKTLIASVALHIVILILLPLLLAYFSKPEVFERPQTFQLVSAPIQTTPPPPTPVPPAPTPPIPTPPTPTPPPTPVPTPTPTPPPVPQPVQQPTPEPTPEPTPREAPPVRRPPEENLDALASLFETLPAPAQISALSDFQFPWYLRQVQQKIEQNWRPPTENRNLAVVLRFIINSDGSVSDLSVVSSSGDRTLDNLATRAVTIAAPFGRLPAGFSGDKLDINLTLRPTRRSS
jgi:TonB family protein